MIFKTDLDAYEFENIERYYLYIAESLENGQRKQAKNLFRELSRLQQIRCKRYLFNNRHFSALELVCRIPEPGRKTIDEYQIHCNYGQGWEHETTSFYGPEAKAELKAYRENHPYPVKLVTKRVKPD